MWNLEIQGTKAVIRLVIAAEWKLFILGYGCDVFR